MLPPRLREAAMDGFRPDFKSGGRKFSKFLLAVKGSENYLKFSYVNKSIIMARMFAEKVERYDAYALLALYTTCLFNHNVPFPQTSSAIAISFIYRLYV